VGKKIAQQIFETVVRQEKGLYVPQTARMPERPNTMARFYDIKTTDFRETDPGHSPR